VSGVVKLEKLHEKQREIGLAFKENRRSVLRCGRRFGKTTLLERMASKAAFYGKRVGWFGPTYKLNLPTYKRILRTVNPVVESKSKIDQIIELRSGGAVEFWTLQDEDAGRSRFYDLVIIDEASLAKNLRETWEQSIAPTLLDRKGSAIMAGTPKGIDQENYFYTACTDVSLGWKEFHAPTASNPMLDPEAVAKLVDEYPPLVYQQEYLAEFVDWNGSAFFAESSLLVDGKPVPIPSRTDQVFAVIDTALKDNFEHDGTAVLYCCKTKIGDAAPLVLLDYDILQIEGALLEDWLPSVNMRLEELTVLTRPRQGNLGIWIEDKASGIVLIQQARRRNMDVTPIDSKLTALGKEGRALSVSGYVYRGEVKISQPCYDKIVNYKGQSRNHLLSQICGFRMGQKDGPRDLLDCFTYSVAIALGNAEGY
jgi:phage terminase large subunit-like protein